MTIDDVLAPAGRRPAKARPIWAVAADGGKPAASPDENANRWMAETGFKAGAGDVLLVPDGDGGVAAALLGLGEGDEPLAAGALGRALPAGDCYFAETGDADLRLASLGFVLGAYRFVRYRKPSAEAPRLFLDSSIDRDELTALGRAVWLARDLVNTPANDLGPDGIEAAAREVAVCDRLIEQLGAPHFAAEQRYIYAVLAERGGDPDRALACLDPVVSDEGEAYAGHIAAVCHALVARLTESRAVRTRALEQMEDLLAAGSLGHAHIWGRQVAAQALLRAGGWTGAERQAERLAAYTEEEPLGWTDLVIRFVRLRARQGRGEAGDEDIEEARRLIAELDRACIRSLIPDLRASFPV